MDYETIMSFIEDSRAVGKSWPEIEQSLTDALNAVAQNEKIKAEQDAKQDAMKAAIQSELHGNVRFNHLDCLPDLEKLTADDVARVMIYYIADTCPELEQHIEDIEDLHNLVAIVAKAIKNSSNEVTGLVKMLTSLKESFEKMESNSKKSEKDCGKCEPKVSFTVNKGLSDFDVISRFLKGIQ